MKVCIIGGVAGGATLAARLRRLDEKAEIIMFEKGPYISFANCGLPYHISGKIENKESLLLQTPSGFKSRFNVDVRVYSEVTSIDRKQKTVQVKDLKTGKTYAEKYDTLVLSPGAEPFVPEMDITAKDKFFCLRNIPDLEKIKTITDKKETKKAVVVGAGFIGVEVAENLMEKGIETHLVELSPQVLGFLDIEMANIALEHMHVHGLNTYMQERVISYDGKTVKLQNSEIRNVDLIICGVGVRPDTKLAQDAGLETNQNKAIIVNNRLQTSDPDIYAVGDAIQVTNFVTALADYIPLAGPANKQARIAADNIAGLDSTFGAVQGSSILKIFDLQVASTGINEKKAKSFKMNYEAIHLHPFSHASYYPGATQLAMKLIFEKNSGKILGAQGVGNDSVDKRIDIIAVAIKAGLKIKDLTELELCYAPPYGSAKDPVNMLGFIAENISKKLVTSLTYDKAISTENSLFIDTRTSAETKSGIIPGAVHIPVDEIRTRMDEIPKDKHIIAYCRVGYRGYIAARILKANGFENVYNLSGGYKSYLNYTYKGTAKTRQATNISCDINSYSGYKKIDLRALQCPGPMMKLTEALKDVKDGEKVFAVASDPGFIKDLHAYCESTGNAVVQTGTQNGEYIAILEKHGRHSRSDTNETEVKMTNNKDKSFIVFSDSLDKAFAAFILANGAKAMGSEVTLFFTFWGLSIIKKKAKTKKNILEKMFDLMLPSGASALSLSKMNMLGLGRIMMKFIMKKKNVASLDELIKTAMENGVKFIACSMSMDVMGIKKEELLDGVEIGGVAHYLNVADKSNVSFMI